MTAPEDTRHVHTSADGRVAVLIPVYNGELFLAQAMESALAQTHPPAEIIVIDDGSCDSSVDLARSYAANHPSIQVHTQPNAGVAAARNRAAQLATAPLLAFLDQDDLWEPTKLERQIEALRASPEAAICVCASKILSQLDDPNTTETVAGLSLPPADQVGPQLYGSLRFQPSAVLIRREPFLAVGGFEPTAQPCEDWDLWLRLEQAGTRFAVVQDPLLIYRFHAANESNNAWKMFHGEMRVFDRRIAPRTPPLLRPLARLRYKSRFLAGVALVEREQRRPHLTIMLRSLLTWPAGDWRRHKIALHMLLKQLHILR